MPGLYASFVYDLLPADYAAEQLRSELSTTHRINSKVFSQQDMVVLLVGGMLPVWGYASWWRWWSGLTNKNGLWIYNFAPIINAPASARSIAARYTELIAALPQEAKRR